MIFAPFDLKTGTLYRLCLFWSGITGMVFQGTTGVHERICRFNSKWIRKRVRVKCDFEIDFKLMGSWYDDKIFPRETYVAFVSPPGWKTDMYLGEQVWKGVWKWHSGSKNGVRIWETWIRKRVRVICDFEIDFKVMGSWYEDKIFPREKYVSPPDWKTDMYFRGRSD